MANPEPDFSIDTKSVQEDEWVIYLKILIDIFESVLSSLTNSCLEHDAIGCTYSMMLIRLNGSN